MNSQIEVVLSCAAILTVALLLLRFFERFRNPKGISEEERTRRKARNLLFSAALMRIIWAATGFYFALASGTALRIRIVIGLCALYFAISFGTTLQFYRKLGDQK